MSLEIQSDIISKILSPAVRLFLRSQVERVEDLEIQIQGHDRQILKGYIPMVQLKSREAVYQGLHLGKVALQGENIRLNIGQVLRGKPLKLLEPIRVTGEVIINETHLNQSLDSFILSNAFKDLLIFLLESNGVSEARQGLEHYQITWENASLREGYFSLIGSITDTAGNQQGINFQAYLSLSDSRTLAVLPKCMEGLPEWSVIPLNPFTVDLGTDVEIERFFLEAGNLSCLGQLWIQP